MGKKKRNKILSACCKAEIRYSDPAPDFIGDKNPTIGTCYCICSKCGKPCNFYTPIRKVWTRNPKTQILEDNRGKLTEKEIKKILKEEDF